MNKIAILQSLGKGISLTVVLSCTCGYLSSQINTTKQVKTVEANDIKEVTVTKSVKQEISAIRENLGATYEVSTAYKNTDPSIAGELARLELAIKELEENIVEDEEVHIIMQVQAAEKQTSEPEFLYGDFELSYALGQYVYEYSTRYLGIPYVWGGTSGTRGLDCSGFVQLVYKELGYNLPRVSRDQAKYGLLVSRQELLPGDLLFFDTTNYRDSSDITTPTKEMQYAIQVETGQVYNTVSHVGIYAGEGIMIHASSGDGMIAYADLNSNYYKNRFLWARRVIY